VSVDTKITGKIGKGIVALIGVGAEDQESDIDYIAKKLVNLRIFDDENGVMNRSIKDIGGEILAVSSLSAVASYSLEYNKIGIHYGHRINYAAVSLISNHKLPEHHSDLNKVLKSGEKKQWIFGFDRCDSINDYERIMSEYGIPVIRTEKFILSKGERLLIEPLCKDECEVEIISPVGKIKNGDELTTEGIYEVMVKSRGGKITTGSVYCRKPWEWYLKNARIQTIMKPQHATTHCESWYGFFSAFLASRHYPDSKLDSAVSKLFDEIMPLMFDFDEIKPLVIPNRIQNVSSLISLLVDKYEINKEKNKKYLILASKFGDWLMNYQREDGAFYNDKTHYTCVIYPAKTLLELWHAELGESDDEYFNVAALRHYQSAQKAVDELVANLENIGTEGEHTLEDGMISCSCLQIAAFALTLKVEERQKYISAAEHMLGVHRCLEHRATPDCRVRGTTIRYWESQYDVMVMKNLICSPHGWSAWLGYALYYLYILTGKKDYLVWLMENIGAGVQLMSLDGDLKWAFCVDPDIKVERAFTIDENNPIEDAYPYLKLENKAFSGKFEERNIGEEYISMISGWYRTSKEQLLNGGYYTCPLILSDKTLEVSRQGGCCDNDVHEIFKCMEETVFKKAFIHQAEDRVLCYNCDVEIENKSFTINLYEKCDTVVIYNKNCDLIIVNNKVFKIKQGINFLKLN